MRFSSVIVFYVAFGICGLQCTGAVGRRFVLEDQFGQPHELDFPSKGKVSILVLADREGSKQVAGWVESLYRRFGGRVSIQGVATLPNVPDVIRTAIRSFFRCAINFPLLMDWGGQLASYLGYAPGKVAIIVIDESGQIVYRAEGKATQEKLEVCFTATEAALEGKPQCP